MEKSVWTDIITNGAFSSELDWIAIDQLGQIGVFSAIMNAPIPKIIGTSYPLYMELTKKISSLAETCDASITTTIDGDFSDWLNYSKKGLFAFDFQDVHRIEKLNQYDLISTPSAPVTINQLELTDELKTIIPILNCNFQDGDLSIRPHLQD